MSMKLTRERRKRVTAAVIKRDGRTFWLCHRPTEAGQGTIERLLAKSLGGTTDLSNLTLCHERCNAHLKDQPLLKKLKMRASWLRPF